MNILVHVKPGLHTPNVNQYASLNAVPAKYKSCQVEVWAVEQSQLVGGYKKIWSKPDYIWTYGDEGAAGIANYEGAQYHPPAFNMLFFTGYMNARPSAEEFYHRYAQIIFSRKPIPCPAA